MNGQEAFQIVCTIATARACSVEQARIEIGIGYVTLWRWKHNICQPQARMAARIRAAARMK